MFANVFDTANILGATHLYVKELFIKEINDYEVGIYENTKGEMCDLLTLTFVYNSLFSDANIG